MRNIYSIFALLILSLWPSLHAKAASETTLVVKTNKTTGVGADSVSFSLSKSPALSFTNERLLIMTQSFSKSLKDVISVKFSPVEVPEASSGTIEPANTIPMGKDYVPKTPEYNQTPIFVPIPSSLSSASFSLSPTSYDYTGEEIRPEVTVKSGETVLRKDVDYEVTYQNNINPGTATITLTGKGAYFGSAIVTFTIVLPPSFITTINGQAVEPSLNVMGNLTIATYVTPTGIVTLNNYYAQPGAKVTVWLQPAEGYWASKDSINIALTDNDVSDLSQITSYYYTMPESGVVTMDIKFYERTDISQDIVTFDASDYKYEGTPVVPVVTVQHDTITLKPDVDFTVAVSDNDAPGLAHLSITGVNRYMGTIDTTFVIKTPYVDLTELSPQVTIAEDSVVYTGQPFTPAVTVTVDGQELVEDTDYTVTYSDNIHAGLGQLTINGIGNYRGTIDTTFVINKALLTVKADTLTRTYGEENPTLTYVMTGFVGEDSADSLTQLPVAATEATAESSVGDYDITLGGGEADDYDFDYVPATLTVVPADMTGVQVTFAEETPVYTGEPVTPAFSVQRGNAMLTADADYDVTFTDNTNAGMATLTIEGRGNYTGATDTTFVIGKALLTVKADTLAKVFGDETPTLTYAVTGFVGNEDATVLTHQPEAATEATVESAVGEYAITIGGAEADNYDFDYVPATLTVTPRSLADATLTMPSDSVAYTSRPVLPELSVQRGSVVLTEGTDYQVTASDNTEVGTAALTIEGQGNYEGRIDTTFVIYLKPSLHVVINDEQITPEIDELFNNSAPATFESEQGVIEVDNLYATTGSTVVLTVTPKRPYYIFKEDISGIELIGSNPADSTAQHRYRYVVPEGGEVIIEAVFSVDSIALGISNRTVDGLRFEVVDGKTVRVLGAREAAPVSVFDARGQQVDAEVARSERELIVRLANQPQGLYIIKVNNKTFKVYRK